VKAGNWARACKPAFLNVARELKVLTEQRGKPGMIVSDHGTEFTSNAMLAWTHDNAIVWHFIAPGKPIQNGF
jgi:putative transposase